jgi:hypothetical protein
MSNEMYEIQWLANTPYLVYKSDEFDGCIVLELTDSQKMAVEEFQSKQWVEAKEFAKSLLNSTSQ